MSNKLTEQEFLEIYEEYKDRVYNQAFRILGTREDAEEAAQDTFIKIYKFYGNFRGESKLSSWIYRIAANVCITKARSKRKDIDYLDEIDEIRHKDTLKTDMNPEEILLSKDMKDTILGLISKMNPKYSSILTLYYFEERNYKEISEILDIPEGTIATHLFRAKNLLKDLVISELKLYN